LKNKIILYVQSLCSKYCSGNLRQIYILH